MNHITKLALILYANTYAAAGLITQLMLVNLGEQCLFSAGPPLAMCDGLCQNGGTCVSPNNCVCQQGFTGKRCETGKTSFYSPLLRFSPQKIAQGALLTRGSGRGENQREQVARNEGAFFALHLPNSQRTKGKKRDQSGPFSFSWCIWALV